MSNESSATKWIVGCLVTGVLGLFLCGGIAVWMVRQGVEAAREAAEGIAEEMDRQAEAMQQASSWNLPGGWTAPGEDAAVDELLPIQAGEWERMFQNTESAVPQINIERETHSGVYATNEQSVDVYVCRVSADDRDAVFERAETEISNSATGHTTMGTDDGTTRTLFYKTWGEQGSGWLVWNGGWLFSIQTADPSVPVGEFMTEYFSAIEAPNVSPFTEVICQPDDTVLVRIDDEEQMLQLVSIDEVPVEEILAACHENYGELWEKRLVEDIVKVLIDMGHSPGETVKLVLRDPETDETRTIDEAPMTEENRRRVYAARYGE